MGMASLQHNHPAPRWLFSHLYFLSARLEMKPSAESLSSKHPATELQPQPTPTLLYFFFTHILLVGSLPCSTNKKLKFRPRPDATLLVPSETLASTTSQAKQGQQDSTVEWPSIPHGYNSSEAAAPKQFQWSLRGPRSTCMDKRHALFGGLVAGNKFSLHAPQGGQPRRF